MHRKKNNGKKEIERCRFPFVDSLEGIHQRKIGIKWGDWDSNAIACE